MERLQLNYRMKKAFYWTKHFPAASIHLFNWESSLVRNMHVPKSFMDQKKKGADEKINMQKY